MRIERKAETEWKQDPSLRSEVANLVAPSYVDATAMLAREFEKNTTIYLLRDEAGVLVSFLMVGWGEIPAETGPVPSVYVGLSATSQGTKGSGQVRQVYQAFIEDAAEWERATGRRLLLWGTTATPSAYHAVNLIFAGVDPRADGAYSSEAVTHVPALRQALGVGSPGHDEHPFVLHGAAENTRYSDAEYSRITAIARRNGFDLFDRLGVDERRGDRLLCVGRVPHAWLTGGDA